MRNVRKPYPRSALFGPWVKKACVSCGDMLGGSVPEAFNRETVCFSCPAMPDELSVSDPLCNNPEGENVMAYPNSADPGQLNEDMIKLLMKQNDLLKQRLALEIEDNGRYRAIIEDQDRVPF